MSDVEKNRSNLEKESKVKYSVVQRGELYLCDFGKGCGSEVSGKKFAIIIQNDAGNFFSSTTIVIACTNRRKKELPVHYKFVFSNDNMLDYCEDLGKDENTILAEQIRTISKGRLLQRIGVMTPEFMEEVQKIIDISFDLKRNYDLPSTEREGSDMEPEHNKERKVVRGRYSYTENVLLTSVGDALEKLDSSKPVEEQAEDFLVSIGMPSDEIILKTSFVVAANIGKITLENIIWTVYRETGIKSDVIEKNLKTNFKKWLKEKSELVEIRTRYLPVTALYKVFVKKVK